MFLVNQPNSMTCEHTCTVLLSSLTEERGRPALYLGHIHVQRRYGCGAPPAGKLGPRRLHPVEEQKHTYEVIVCISYYVNGRVWVLHQTDWMTTYIRHFSRIEKYGGRMLEHGVDR